MSTKEITVQGVTVSVSAPYVEGQTLTEAEAKALNQVRAENVRNNQAKAIKELKETVTDEAELQKQAQALISAYDAEYVFTLASVGGGRAALTPVEKEAKAIARDYIAAQLKEKGITQKAYIEANGAESIKIKIAEFSAHPKVIAMAEKAVKDREKNAALADEISL